jgi:hypothetical protein
MAESNYSSDDLDIDEMEEKTMAAMGVLKTLSSLILAIESSTSIVIELESIVIPAIRFILENSILDLFEEVFEIIGTILFCAKIVTPVMWEVFPLIYATFKADAVEYLEEMHPSLDNFIAYGKEVIIQNQMIQVQLLDIIATLLQDDDCREADQIRACQLMESMMLNLRGSIDDHIPKFLELVCKRMAKKVKTTPFRIHLIETVLNALYYNPCQTCALLEHIQWMGVFFEYWFKNLQFLNRVHDKKLSILTALSILETDPEKLPASLGPFRGGLFELVLKIFQSYPEALQNRDREGEDDEEDVYDENGFIQDDDEFVDEELDQLAQEAAEALPDQELEDDDDDDKWEVQEFLEEDICFLTPLDPLNAYICFANTFGVLLQRGEGPLLQARLNPEQTLLLTQCIDKAKELAAE